MLSSRLFFPVFYGLLLASTTAQAAEKNCLSRRGTTSAQSFVDLTAKQLVDVVNACSAIRILPTLSLPGEVVMLESTVTRNVSPEQKSISSSRPTAVRTEFQSSWKVLCCPVADHKRKTETRH